jgi:gamma-glutamyltranspeptidase/glutathione hydrolase
MRRYYSERAVFLGDPDFAPQPLRAMLEPRHIRMLRESINPDRATPSETLQPGKLTLREGANTTHFSIVDAQGNAVSFTYTINNIFGSGVTVPRLGFLLNDEMDDFTARPGVPNSFGIATGELNAIEPGKRPLSSMTPTIVLRDGKLFLVLGAPGGPRIITGVLQVMLNVIDFGMNVQQAVDAPRFHHQWLPDQISMERGFSPDTIALLEAKGHKIVPIGNVASVEAILSDGGWLQGASDGRAGGKAAGF